jgi:cyclohexadienyl dehydratase
VLNKSCLPILLACLLSLTSFAQTLYTEQEIIKRMDELVSQRLELMPQVAANKWLNNRPVTDNARERQVLQNVRKQATELGLHADSLEQFFAIQISNASALQEEKIRNWNQSGCKQCPKAPSLDSLRKTLDKLGSAIMHAAYLAAPYKGWAGKHSIDQIQKSGMLRLGVTADYAPFSIMQNDSLQGADVELGKTLAASLGVVPVFIRTSWSTLQHDLQNNAFDLAIGGVSVTAARKSIAPFSIPYHYGGKTLLTRCQDTAVLNTVAAVNNPGVRLIVNKGGTNEAVARTVFNLASLIVHPDNIGVFAEITAGRADVMVTDDVEADLKSIQNPLLCRSMKGTINESAKAVWVNGDTALLEAVNTCLKMALADGKPTYWLQKAMVRQQ